MSRKNSGKPKDAVVASEVSARVSTNGTARGKGTVPAEPVAVLRSAAQLLADLPYREGSFVVHPKYGLGKIERILGQLPPGPDGPFLEIRFPYQDMKLTLPVEQVERSGMRRPIARRDIDAIYRVLKGRATIDAKRRSAKRVLDYRKRLSLGDPTSLAEAVRDLGRLSLKKSLSYEERKILGTALRILSREVALARGREPDEVRKEIEQIVYR
jgi:CarD family transcriptional regulator